MSDDDFAEDEVELPIDGILDLHTFHPREVKDLVPDYLDECVARGIGEVRIIHGKGKGVLRRTVHAILERRSDVLEFGLAPAHRGGWGATLVTLQIGDDVPAVSALKKSDDDNVEADGKESPTDAAPREPRIKVVVRWLMTIAMVWVGVLHFIDPEPFIRIVPDWLPNARALVYISGAFEILGGIGLAVPQTRRFSAFGLIALFIAVFPANIHMAIHEIQLEPGADLPVWAMWARLPFQFVFIALAYWMTRPRITPPSHPRTKS